jgi:hypothetical protein
MLPLVRTLPLVLLDLTLLLGCAPENTDVVCAGPNAPAELHLANVTPAPGSTVANDAIVHSFSVQDDIAFEDILLAYPPAHTAGASDPALTFSYKISSTTVDYTGVAVTWEAAPGHVEIDAPVIYQTPEGCSFQLPTPLFSYDLAGPTTP